MAYMDFHEAARSVSDENAGRKSITEQMGETAQASTQAATYEAIRNQDSTDFEVAARDFTSDILPVVIVIGLLFFLRSLYKYVHKDET